MSFDAADYRKRVLTPYKGPKLSELQGALRELKNNPGLAVPTKLDLVGLYDIGPGMDDAAVAARVADVKNVFSMANAAIKGIAPNLLELHGFLVSRNPTFTQAKFWKRQLADRDERSKVQLADFAHDVGHELQILKVVTPARLRQLARSARLPESISDHALATAVTDVGLQVVPEIVPPSVSVPSSVTGDLAKTTCSSLVEAIFVDRPPSFSVIGGFRASNGVTLTIATVETARRQTDLKQSNENDWIKKVLGGVLSVAHTDRELHDLLLAHFIERGRAEAQASSLQVLALKSLTDTGLDQLDAARILFQFAGGSAKPAGFPEVHDKVAAGALREARRLFDALVSQADGPPSDAQELARAALTGAEERLKVLRATAKAAAERGDIDTAARALDEAQALCADDESIEAAARSLPPAAPLNLVVSTGSGGRSVSLTWTPGFGASEDLHYRVTRKPGVAPRTPFDGDLVAEPAGTHCVDPTPPLAVPLYYGVAAARGGGFSAVTAQSIIVLPAVSDVSITSDLTSVNLQWNTPAGAKTVVVTQTDADGSITDVPVNAHSGASMTGLVTGASYRYELTATYRNDAGAELRSATVRVQAVTRGSARAVPTLSVQQTAGSSGATEVEASWQEVPGFAVEVWTFTKPPPWSYGTRVPMSQLASHGRRLAGATTGDQRREGVRGVVEPGLRSYLAITRDGDEGVVGQRQELGICPPVRGARGERFGDVVVLSCEWPGDDFDVHVSWSGPDGPAATVVTLAKYQEQGGFRIPVGRAGSQFVLTTRPAGSTAPWTSPPVTVDIPAAPTAVTYRVGWQHPLFRPARATLTFAAEGPVDPVEIAIVAKAGSVMPFSLADGIPLERRTFDFRDDAEQTVTVTVDKLGKHYWVRAFAAVPDQVRIVDPPSQDLRGA